MGFYFDRRYTQFFYYSILIVDYLCNETFVKDAFIFLFLFYVIKFNYLLKFLLELFISFNKQLFLFLNKKYFSLRYI